MKCRWRAFRPGRRRAVAGAGDGWRGRAHRAVLLRGWGRWKGFLAPLTRYGGCGHGEQAPSCPHTRGRAAGPNGRSSAQGSTFSGPAGLLWVSRRRDEGDLRDDLVRPSDRRGATRSPMTPPARCASTERRAASASSGLTRTLPTPAPHSRRSCGSIPSSARTPFRRALRRSPAPIPVPAEPRPAPTWPGRPGWGSPMALSRPTSTCAPSMPRSGRPATPSSIPMRSSAAPASSPSTTSADPAPRPLRPHPCSCSMVCGVCWEARRNPRPLPRDARGPPRHLARRHLLSR